MTEQLSKAVARLARHRAWAERTLRWVRSREKRCPEVKRTIDVAEEVLQRVVMAAADDEAKKTEN